MGSLPDGSLWAGCNWLEIHPQRKPAYEHLLFFIMKSSLRQKCCLCAMRVAFAPFDSIFFLLLFFAFFCLFVFEVVSFRFDVLNLLGSSEQLLYPTVYFWKTFVCLFSTSVESCLRNVCALLSTRCFCQEAADLQMLLQSVATSLRLLWNLFCSLLEKMWGETRLAQRICK